jgi:hypothetical protein
MNLSFIVASRKTDPQPAEPCSVPFPLVSVPTLSLADAAKIPALPDTPTFTPRSADADVT